MLSGISQSSQMMSQLFSRLDTKSQGYLDKSDLATAFSQIAANASSSGTSSTSNSVDDVFAALDSDSDGKVTESEFSTVLSNLQSQLDSQFNQMRMQGGGGHGGPHGMSGMPPPPPADDAGFTQDELSAQLDEIGSSDSQRSSLISNIVNNFSAADSDGDGKVSFSEAMAYDQSTQSSTSGTTSSSSSTTSRSSTDSTSTTASSSNSDAQVMMKIMQLIHAYGNVNDQAQSGIASLLSATA